MVYFPADEIADLNDRYIGLQQTRDNEREQYELQIQTQRNEYQEMKDQLTSENMILGTPLFPPSCWPCQQPLLYPVNNLYYTLSTTSTIPCCGLNMSS